MITTRNNITVQYRESWQPCAVCGVNTPYAVSFMAQDGKLTVWPFCTLDCYSKRHTVHESIIRNREWSWCAELRSL